MPPKPKSKPTPTPTKTISKFRIMGSPQAESKSSTSTPRTEWGESIFEPLPVINDQLVIKQYLKQENYNEIIKLLLGDSFSLKSTVRDINNRLRELNITNTDWYFDIINTIRNPILGLPYKFDILIKLFENIKGKKSLRTSTLFDSSIAPAKHRNSTYFSPSGMKSNYTQIPYSDNILYRRNNPTRENLLSMPYSNIGSYVPEVEEIDTEYIIPTKDNTKTIKMLDDFITQMTFTKPLPVNQNPFNLTTMKTLSRSKLPIYTQSEKPEKPQPKEQKISSVCSDSCKSLYKITTFHPETRKLITTCPNCFTDITKS